MSGTTSLLLVSNRGPVSFAYGADGDLLARRGAGGLVSALSSLHPQPLWVCAALGDADREAARSSDSGHLELLAHPQVGPVQMLDMDPRVLHRAYNGVANSTLWFLHHLLWATPMLPVFDSTWRREWDSYRTYNETFADAVAQEAAPGAKVLVQDYHLSLLPALLRERRPDLRIAHFSHTPWAPPDYFRLLPTDTACQLLSGLLGADHIGFLAPRWAAAFLDCCADVLGAQVDRGSGSGSGSGSSTVSHAGRTSVVAVHALGVDDDDLHRRARQPDVEARRGALAEQLGGCQVLVRIDRTELSKNIVRGFLAYRELLRTRPQWLGHVVHVAFAYPSRHDLPAYREYTAAVLRLADEINEEFGTVDWQPILLQVDDDYARSLAAYRLADVLLVNPVRDGMNLVAKEGPLLADKPCALVLSTEAGAAEELGAHALLVNPYDVTQTAQALHEALAMTAEEREQRRSALVEVVRRRPPSRWLAEQVDALDDLPGAVAGHLPSDRREQAAQSG